MYKVWDFYNAMDVIAPFNTAEDWDNVGLLVGDKDAAVEKALIALDATESVIDEAVAIGANLIITHHPVIFHPVKHVTADGNIWRLAASGISVICAHTNLDMANGGVNDVLADLLELVNRRPLKIMKTVPNVKSDNPATQKEITLGIVGELIQSVSPGDFAAFVREKLGLSTVCYADGGKNIATVAICSGDGTDYFSDAIDKNADAYVTGESKHHILLESVQKGITYINCGHFASENVVIEPLVKKLGEALAGAEIVVSKTCTDRIRYLPA